MSEMKNGMRDCPHCGGRPYVSIRDAPNGRLHKIECSNRCQSEDDRYEVIKNWNKRITPCDQ